MTLIKLDDAEAKLEALQITGLLYSSDVHYNSGLEDAVKALRALPTVSVTDEMVERAGLAANEAMGYDPECTEGQLAARAALEAALGATVSDGWEDKERAEWVENHLLASLEEIADARWIGGVDAIQKFARNMLAALGPLPAPPSE